MKKAVAIAMMALSGYAAADGDDHDRGHKGIPHLDHVFVVMMENHGYAQILNNPAAPFINSYAKSANLAKNYFAVAHPSLTNYLEVVGGSNFGVLSDNSPDWHNATCQTNLSSGVADTDTPSTGPVCPIQGVGMDAPTPAIDCTNEVSCDASAPVGDYNLDGVKSLPAASTQGKTIADQLAAWGGSWKSYQENLPLGGADGVNNADGFFSNLTNVAALNYAGDTTPVSNGQIVALYAVKHNPFVYFQSVQEGTQRGSSLANVVGFDGNNGLYADLATGRVPNYSFIVPNQCNDMHGKSGQGPFCDYDYNNDGSQVGLNPALVARGDITVQRLVGAIKASPAWREGNSAIVVLWDENDYSVGIPNQVVTIVDTNYGVHGVQSSKYYNHFSLLKTIESGLGLPCLNHACDADVTTMDDLFAQH